MSDILSEIELAASDFVKASVSGRIRLEIDDVVVFPSRFGVGGKAARTELFLICEYMHTETITFNWRWSSALPIE